MIDYSRAMSATVLPEVAARFAPYWRLSIVAASEGENPAATRPELLCGACGSGDVRSVGSGAGGSVAGGEVWEEVACGQCHAVTEYRHEWG